MNQATMKRGGSASWITGFRDTAEGQIPVISTKLSKRDIIDDIKARLGNFRNNYKVEPGLYCTGNPNADSPVLVTANYKLTFDTLRSELENIDCWIMVLDTKGINVWCAAGKGTFGTSEVINRIQTSRLSGIVSHKTIILPQLGAPGVNAHEVKRETGFRVVYGPVRAHDVPFFLQNNMKKDRKMRTVTFNLKERFAVMPIELISVIPVVLLAYLAVLLVDWIAQGSVNFRQIWFDYVPFLSGVLAGGIAMPLLLPFIPARSFTIKGVLTGIVAAVIIDAAYRPTAVIGGVHAVLIIATSALFGLMYTGSTTYTSVSGVSREVKKAFPVVIPVFCLSVIAEIVMKFFR